MFGCQHTMSLPTKSYIILVLILNSSDSLSKLVVAHHNNLNFIITTIKFDNKKTKL